MCPHRAPTSPGVANPPVPGIPGNIPHHPGWESGSDYSHQEGASPSHTYVFFPWEFSLCRYLVVIHCDTKMLANLLDTYKMMYFPACMIQFFPL